MLSSSRSFRKEEVEGKTVIDSSGKVTGKVKDIVFSLDGNVTLIVEKSDGVETQLPLSRVMGISEFVVTKEPNSAYRGKGSTGASTAGVEEAKTCKFCGAEMPQDTSWCPSCGKSQI